MHRALEEGEFQAWFQPKVDVTTGRTVSAEALIRWNSAQFGFLTPAAFVPLFEKNGFIQELDFYMLEQVCRFLRDRLDRGEPVFPVSINQSRLHGYNDDYLRRLRETVGHYQIPHELIEMEVTESVLLENMERVEENIGLLRAEGYLVGIDNFGTGYTSLSFLQDVDVDVIKMDRSLLLGAQASEKNLVMLRYLVEMSHAMGMRVVCEGVETPEQAELVRSLECDMIQGYYCAKPMPEREFAQYLQDGQ